MTTDQSSHTREPVPATRRIVVLYTIRLHNIKEELFMDMKQMIPGMDITYEEFITAYRAADPETRREIERLLGLEE